MKKCSYYGCENTKIKALGMCQYYYNNNNNGDKERGLYVIYFKLNEGTYFYIGKAWRQPVRTEINKHLSELRNYEDNYIKDKKFIRYFKKICGEHENMSVDEIISNYVEYSILQSESMLGGTPIQYDDSTGSEDIILDKSTIKDMYLSSYVTLIDEYFTKNNGLKKDIDYSKLTDDKREILKIINYEYLAYDALKTQKINEYIKMRGEQFCLNERKANALM